MTADFAAANRIINDLYEHVGTRIAKQRRNLNLTQEDVAVRIGLSRSGLANLEAGRQRSPLHVLIAVAQALETTLPALLGDEPLPAIAAPLPHGAHAAVPAVISARGNLRTLLADLDKLRIALDEIDTEGQQ